MEMTEKTTEQLSMVQLLTSHKIPVLGAGRMPTARYEVTRLSELIGTPVIFTLTGLPYGKVEEMRRLTHDTDVSILVAGLVDPDPKDPALKERYGGAVVADALKNMLLPGEIADLSMAVEKLSGYRGSTIREVKNG